ncbi:MAG: response regulator [Magnetococcus sp. WYHC-3]
MDASVDVSEPASPSRSRDQRQWERRPFSRKMVVLLGDDAIPGCTHDVSLGGVLLETERASVQSWVGRTGSLIIEQDQNQLTFPCQVVRAEAHSLAISFFENPATFGLVVSQEMLLELLTRINNILASPQDLHVMLQRSLPPILEHLQAEGASVFLVSDDGREVVCQACAGPVDITGVRLPVHEGIVGRSLATRRIQSIPNVLDDADFTGKVDDFSGFSTRSLICIPLISRDRALGALEIVNKLGNGIFAGQDEAVLGALASAMALAVDNHHQKRHTVELERRHQEAIARQRDELDLLVRQRTAELSASSELKTRFLAEMSHEIRTPMNAILGMVHLARSAGVDAHLHGYLGSIDDAVQSLLRILDDTLDISRIESGRLELEEIPFVVDDLLERLHFLHSMKAIQQGIDLVIDPDPDVPPSLMGDPTRLGQILTNLLGNALKFTREGEVVLRIRREVSVSPRHCMLTFSVRDSGIGMTPEAIERLFQPFSQGDGSVSRRFGGSGLGLAISQNLCQRMGGLIHVSSTEGEGSLFSFTLEFPLPEGVALREASPVPSPGGDMVLVVSPGAASRAMLERHLSAAGWRVKCCGDGLSALQFQEQASLDGTSLQLVLVDQRLADLSGQDLARMLRLHPDWPDAGRILLLRNHDASGSEEHLDRAGFSGVLDKPLRPRSLLQLRGSGGHAPVGGRTQTTAAAAPVVAMSTLALRGAHLLLVEDNDINRAIAAEILTVAGLSVEGVKNGMEALQRLHRQDGPPFDGILMDVVMPGMDGLEVTRRIRSAHAPFSHLPIIALTANALTGQRQRSLDAGMNDHITKPFRAEELFAVLHRWVTPAARAGAGREPPPLPVSGVDRSQAGGVTWPELPGVSLQAVDPGLLHDPEFYRSMLLRFSEDMRGFRPTLESLLAQGQRAEAIRLVHSLKGNAANLGVLEVMKTAGALESALEQPHQVGIQSLQEALLRMGEAFTALEPALQRLRDMSAK